MWFHMTNLPQFLHEEQILLREIYIYQIYQEGVRKEGVKGCMIMKEKCENEDAIYRVSYVKNINE